MFGSPFDEIDFSTMFSIDIDGDYPQWIKNIVQSCRNSFEPIFQWEHKDIDAIATQLKTEMHNYIKIGMIANFVRQNFYGKWGNSSYSDFCTQSLGKSVRRINDYIGAADIALKLINDGFTVIPQNVSQCQPLFGLNLQELSAVWAYICEFVPENKLTAETIKRIVLRWGQTQTEFPDTPKPLSKCKIEVKEESSRKLNELAKRYGMSIDDYIDRMYDKELGDVVKQPEEQPKEEEKTEEQPKAKIIITRNQFNDFLTLVNNCYEQLGIYWKQTTDLLVWRSSLPQALSP